MSRRRTARVVVAMMNTAAIRIAYTFSRMLVTRRPNAQIPGWDAAIALSSAVNKRPAATAAADNIMATNSNPLPRNTVAKSRSSPSPIRSRTTPMNHKNAMAENGSRFKATRIALRRLSSASQSPVLSGSLGVTVRTRVSATARRTEKTMPATAAARGDLIAVRAVTAADMWPLLGQVRHAMPDAAEPDRSRASRLQGLVPLHPPTSGYARLRHIATGGAGGTPALRFTPATCWPFLANARDLGWVMGRRIDDRGTAR